MTANLAAIARGLAALAVLRVASVALEVAQACATGSPARRQRDSEYAPVGKSASRTEASSGDLVDITRRQA